MANLYESMNKYFESKYGDDLDNVKKVEKKSLNEALLLEKKLDLESLLFPLDTEGKMDKKEKKQMAKDFLRDLKDSFGLKGSALNIVLKWFFSDSLPAKAKKYYDTEKNAYSKYEEPWDFSYGDVIREFLSEPLDYDIFQGKDPKEVKIVKEALVKYDPKGYANLKEGVTSREKMGESIRSRRAMKEARGRTSGKFTVQKALLDAHLDLPRDLSPESQKTAVKKALDVLKSARAAAETDAEKKQYDNAINILTNRPTPVAFNSLGAWYSGISMSEQMGSKSRMMKESANPLARIKKIDTRKYKLINKNSYDNVNTYEVKDGSLGKNINQFDAWGADLYYDVEENNWWVMNDMINPEDTASNTIAEAIKKAYDEFKDWDGDYEDAKVVGYAIDDHEIDYNAPADEDSEFNFYLIDLIHSYEDEKDEDKDFDESLKRTPKFKINRRKVESLKSAPKRHKLGESKVIISRKSMKEDLGEDIARYQRYVDYDMKHYGKISKKTQDLIDKAGLQVVKDQYGDYEVTAGHYEEACRSRKSMGSKKKSEITEAKEEKDLWDIIYGELTEDGSQYIVPETGKPRINKGAGYKFDSQIAVDRAGNIVVKAKEERDLKAAIDIADKHKDNGVTYNIDQSKYDKNYPYWMTIEIPEKYKECFKESKLTEKNWEYSVSNSVSREFRDAIQSDDEDYERVRRAIIAVYDDIHENAPELLDDDDYEDWVTEEAEVVDLDDDDDVNYLLTNLYDFCDNANIWIGI